MDPIHVADSYFDILVNYRDQGLEDMVNECIEAMLDSIVRETLPSDQVSIFLLKIVLYYESYMQTEKLISIEGIKYLRRISKITDRYPVQDILIRLNVLLGYAHTLFEGAPEEFHEMAKNYYREALKLSENPSEQANLINLITTCEIKHLYVSIAQFLINQLNSRSDESNLCQSILQSAKALVHRLRGVGLHRYAAKLLMTLKKIEHVLAKEHDQLYLTLWLEVECESRSNIPHCIEPDWVRYRNLLSEARDRFSKSDQSASSTLHAYNQSIQTLVRIIIEDSMLLIGQQPYDYCFAAFDKLGDGTLVPDSSLAYILIVEHKHAYFEKLLEIVNSKMRFLEHEGLGSTENSPANYRADYSKERFYCTPIEIIDNHYSKKFADYDTPYTDSKATLFSTLLHGSANLWKVYEKNRDLFNARVVPNNRLMYEELAIFFLHKIQSDLYHCKKYLVKEKTFPLNEIIYDPLINTLNYLALFYNVVQSTPQARIDALHELRIFSHDFTHACKLAVRQINTVRCRVQQVCMNKAIKWYDVVTTSPGEDRYVKLSEEEFNQIKQIQRVVLQPLHRAISNFLTDPFNTQLEDHLKYAISLRKQKAPSLLSSVNTEAAGWDDQLSQLGQEYHPADAANLHQFPHKPTLQYWSSEGIKQLVVLSDSIRDQLFQKDADGILLDKQLKEGRRRVFVVKQEASEASADTYWKFFPENPGYQQLTSLLANQITGYSLLSTFARLEYPYSSHSSRSSCMTVSYPVLISKPAGMTLIQLAQQDLRNGQVPLKEAQSQLDPRSFSLKFFESLVGGYEDENPTNIVVEPCYGKDNALVGNRLLAIDSDHAFHPSVRTQGIIMKEIKVNWRSVVFCMDSMNQAVHPEAVDAFLSLDAVKIIQNLHETAKCYEATMVRYNDKDEQGLFNISNGEILAFFNAQAQGQTKDNSCLIPLDLSEATWLNVYIRFKNLQMVLRDFRNKSESITHFRVLQIISPEVAVFYEQGLNRGDMNPIQRFQLINTRPEKQAAEIQKLIKIPVPKIEPSSFRLNNLFSENHPRQTFESVLSSYSRHTFFTKWQSPITQLAIEEVKGRDILENLSQKN